VSPLSQIQPLEAGDEAYVQDVGPVFCSVVGTIGAGDSVWQPIGTGVASGFQTQSAANFYSASVAGVCPGANDFIVVALAVPFTGRAGGFEQMIAATTSGNTGWRLGWIFGQLGLQVFDGGGGPPLNLGIPISVVAIEQLAGKQHAICARVRQVGGNTDISLWVGPAQKGSLVGVAGVSPSALGTLRVGSALGGSVIEMDGCVCGLGYYEGTQTDDQLRVLMGRCIKDWDLPLDLVPWTSAWTGADLAGVAASIPATVGTGTLTRQGAPTTIAGYFPPA
jgi:hypothetical protein